MSFFLHFVSLSCLNICVCGKVSLIQILFSSFFKEVNCLWSLELTVFFLINRIDREHFTSIQYNLFERTIFVREQNKLLLLIFRYNFNPELRAQMQKLLKL